MGRWAVLCLVAAGCGRVGFDPFVHGDDDEGTEPTFFVLNHDTARNTSVILELELATGELRQRFEFTGFGVLGGLAAWDAKTLYASGNNTIVEIALDVPSAKQIQTFTGNMASLERDGTELVGVTDSGQVVRFIPGDAFAMVDLHRVPTGAITVDGGDLTRLESGTWLWWANTQTQLYGVDLASGAATPLGTQHANMPYVSGLVHTDDGRLFVTSGITDELLELDPANGNVLARRPLCMPCPTPYDLDSGDLTRTR
jgi:hypothetical protein